MGLGSYHRVLQTLGQLFEPLYLPSSPCLLIIPSYSMVVTQHRCHCFSGMGRTIMLSSSSMWGCDGGGGSGSGGMMTCIIVIVVSVAQVVPSCHHHHCGGTVVVAVVTQC